MTHIFGHFFLHDNKPLTYRYLQKLAQPLTIDRQVTITKTRKGHYPDSYRDKNNTVMNSSKVNTQNSASSKSPRLLSGQKTLSAIVAVALAMVTLFQAGAANSHEAAYVTAEEAALVAEFDQYFAEEAIDMELEEMVILEELENNNESVKVYNQHNELIGEGNPDSNPLLGKLVNQADYLSTMGADKYYRVTE